MKNFVKAKIPDENLEQSIASVASTIIDCWDDWDGEAQHVAQCEQSDVAYRQVMMDHVIGALRRAIISTEKMGDSR